MDINDAERLADQLIATEIGRQDQMWGRMNERADISKGQLFQAGLAQLDALFDRQNEEPDAFDCPPAVYPPDWSGFRDYGSDIANLVVANAFIRQEIKRKLMNDEDYTRTSRSPDQTFNPLTGLPAQV